MSIDASTLPVSPIFVIAAIGYAAVAALITGPEIAKREMANVGWQATCQADLIADLETTRRPHQAIPEVPNVGDLLCSVYPELSELCAIIPDPNTGAQTMEAQLRIAEEQRLHQAASGTAHACLCAEQSYIEGERLSLALYAASGRLVTPPSVENREAALSRALHAPICRRVAQ